VPKQLRINRALGDGAAVDGNELPVLARRQRVNDLRKGLLARPALAGDEHRHIGGGHLRGHLNGVVQRRRVADDAEPLLDGLNFLRSQGDDFLLVDGLFHLTISLKRG
jgi:hypothetical protein